VVGTWDVDGHVPPEDVEHIAATVKEEDGFERGYWGQAPGDSSLAHAVVVFASQDAAASFADGVRRAIPPAKLSLIEVMTHA
jgi:hypothetical protein